jgi:quercetin dioxygenase-like cupin family protein
VALTLVTLAAADPPSPGAGNVALGYTHLYSDADGVSHFKVELFDFKPLGPTASKSLSIHALSAQGASLLRLHHGATEDWHAAPRTQFMVAVQGESEVTAGDGKKLRLKPGDIMLMDDTTGKGHRTAALGSQDHVAMVIPVATSQ